MVAAGHFSAGSPDAFSSFLTRGSAPRTPPGFPHAASPTGTAAPTRAGDFLADRQDLQ